MPGQADPSRWIQPIRRPTIPGDYGEYSAPILGCAKLRLGHQECLNDSVGQRIGVELSVIKRVVNKQRRGPVDSTPHTGLKVCAYTLAEFP